MTSLGFTRLGSNPQLFAGLPDASFDNDIRIETPAHFADVYGRSLELERRRSRYHLQSWNVREQIDDFFADPVAEVVLLWIGTNVHERQHGNGCSARRLRQLPRLWIQPAKNRHVTAGPHCNQNRIISSRALVIFLQLRSKAASLHANNRIDVRIVVGGTLEHVYCDRELF